MTRSQDVRSPWAGLGSGDPMSAMATPISEVGVRPTEVRVRSASSWEGRYEDGAGPGFKPAPARTALSPETALSHWLASSAAWVFAKASVQAPISL